MKWNLYLTALTFVALLICFNSTSVAETAKTEGEITPQGKHRSFVLTKESISLQQWPTSIDEFIRLRDAMATTPEGASAIFIIAMTTYGKDKNLGKQFFTIALDRSLIIKSNSHTAYRGYIPGDKVMYFIKMMHNFSYRGNLYLGNIYVEGTDYNNGYDLPQNGPYIMSFNQRSVRDENNVVIYIKTTSGNAPRPLVLRKNNRGIWKAAEVSSLFVGPMREAKKVMIDDDL